MSNESKDSGERMHIVFAYSPADPPDVQLLTVLVQAVDHFEVSRSMKRAVTEYLAQRECRGFDDETS